LIDCDTLLENAQGLESQNLKAVLNSYRRQIREMINRAEDIANMQVEGIVKQAVARMMTDFTHEIQRMQALKKHNPSVRNEEIQLIQEQGMSLHQHLQAARLRLDAVRLIVTL
jgi:ATP-dependent helicase HepA